MEEQQKYQPLLEKILENLELEKNVQEPSPSASKYGLEVPTLRSKAAESPSLAQQLSQQDSSGALPVASGYKYGD